MSEDISSIKKCMRLVREIEMRSHWRFIISIFVLGGICAFIVVLGAYAAELRCENNSLIAENKELQTTIDTLDINLKSANSVDHIESVATEQLGMVYPKEDECIYMSSADSPKQNLALEIRENAYN